MSPLIKKRVVGCRRRLNWLNLIDKTFRAIFIGLIVGSVLMLISRVAETNIATYSLPGIGVVILMSFCAAMIWAFVTRINEFEAAVAIDRQLKLKERISTAMHYHSPKTPLEQAVLEDAEKVSDQIEPSKNFRYNFKRNQFWIFLPILLIVGLSFVDPVNLFSKQRKKAPTQNLAASQDIVEVVKKIQKERKKLEENQDNSNEEVKKLNSDMNKMVKKFQAGKLTKPQMIGEISSMKDKMQKRREKLEDKLKKKKAKDLNAEKEYTQNVIKNIDKGKFEEAAIDLLKMKKDVIKKLKNGDLTEEQIKTAAEELEQVAKQMGANSELGKSLQDAAMALRSGDIDQLEKSMNVAAEDFMGLETAIKEIVALQNMEGLLGVQKKSLMSDKAKQSKKQGKNGNQAAAGSKQGKTGQKAQNKSGSKTQSGQNQNSNQGQKNSGQQGQKNQQQGQQQQGQQGQQQNQQGQQQNQQKGDQGQNGQTPNDQQGQSSQNSGQNQQGNSSGEGQGKNNQSGSQSGSQGQSNQSSNSPQGSNSAGQCKGGSCGGCSQCSGGGKSGDGNNQGQNNRKGNSSNKQGQSKGKGGGFGGPGQGKGNIAPESGQKTGFVKSKIPQQMDVGEIIAIIRRKGDQTVGESTVDYQKVIEAYEQDAEETLRKETIPLNMKDLVRDYMESIKPTE